MTLEEFLRWDCRTASWHRVILPLDKRLYHIYGGLGGRPERHRPLKSMNLGWFAIDQAEETSEAHFFRWLHVCVLIYRISDIKGLTANPAIGVGETPLY